MTEKMHKAAEIKCGKENIPQDSKRPCGAYM